VDIMGISKPDDLGDITNLGLTLVEAKQLLARVQCEISTARAREHAVRRGSGQKLAGCGGHRYDRPGDVDLGVVNALGIAIDRRGQAQRGSWRRRNGDQPA
jgi:hypothetical protein